MPVPKVGVTISYFISVSDRRRPDASPTSPDAEKVELASGRPQISDVSAAMNPDGDALAPGWAERNPVVNMAPRLGGVIVAVMARLNSEVS
jgi:hypothetical protein